MKWVTEIAQRPLGYVMTVANHPRLADREAEAAVAIPPFRCGPGVLVVDDDEFVGRMFRRALDDSVDTGDADGGVLCHPDAFPRILMENIAIKLSDVCTPIK